MKPIQSFKVATFRSLSEAKQGVDYLATVNFPVEKVSIIADDIIYAEDTSHQSELGKVLFSGFVKGAVLGAVLGALVGVGGVVEPLITGLLYATYGALILGAIGAILAALVHMMKRRRGGLGELESAKYHISAYEEVAEQAQKLLGRKGFKLEPDEALTT